MLKFNMLNRSTAVSIKQAFPMEATKAVIKSIAVAENKETNEVQNFYNVVVSDLNNIYRDTTVRIFFKTSMNVEVFTDQIQSYAPNTEVYDFSEEVLVAYGKELVAEALEVDSSVLSDNMVSALKSAEDLGTVVEDLDYVNELAHYNKLTNQTNYKGIYIKEDDNLVPLAESKTLIGLEVKVINTKEEREGRDHYNLRLVKNKVEAAPKTTKVKSRN